MNYRILAPLALVGAVFAAVSVGLYVFYKPRPLWTTSSSRTQNGITFIGVYKGIPKHLLRPYGGTGYTADSGDLWAYFRVDRSRQSEITSSRLFGRRYATVIYQSVRREIPLHSDNSQAIIAVPVPSEYPPALRNGSLTLYNSDQILGSWKLKDMPKPKPVIAPSEPNRLEAKAAGCTFKFKRNPLQTAWQSRIATYPGSADLQMVLDATTPKSPLNDEYEVEWYTTRTTWQHEDSQGYFSEILPLGHKLVSIEKLACSYRVADRIEVEVKVCRYRTQPDFVVLRNAVLQRPEPADSRGYRLINLANPNLVSSSGLRFKAICSGSDYGWNADSADLALECKEALQESIVPASRLSRSTGKPIDLLFQNTHGMEIQTRSTRLHFDLELPKNIKKTQTIKIAQLKVPFKHKVVLEEDAVRLLGPLDTQIRPNEN